MSTAQLSHNAMAVIDAYLGLSLPEKIPCPYMNNRRLGIRGGLRAQIGKGSPDEIVEETKITALKEKIDLEKLTKEQLIQFLVNHHLGIDCSGFVYHVLNAELKARRKQKMKLSLSFPQAKKVLQKIRAWLRPIENTNVQTFAHATNSHSVALTDIQPGDLIVMLDNGKKQDRDHVLLVHHVDTENNQPAQLHYTHSFAWHTDGKYGGRVRQGIIRVKDKQASLLQQQWIEDEKEGTNNGTFQHAREAQTVEIRRLHALS